MEGEASFRESELVQLDEDTAFYLPPLVVTLLSSFCKDVGNRAVRHYIEHHRPLQKARAPRPNSGRCPHAAPNNPSPHRPPGLLRPHATPNARRCDVAPRCTLTAPTLHAYYLLSSKY